MKTLAFTLLLTLLTPFLKAEIHHYKPLPEATQLPGTGLILLNSSDELTLVDATTLEKRYYVSASSIRTFFLNANKTSLYYTALTGLHRLDLKSGETKRLSTIPNISDIFADPNNPEIIHIIHVTDKPTVSLSRISTATQNAENSHSLLASVTPNFGEGFEETQVFLHLEKKSVLLFTHEFNYPKTAYDNREYFAPQFAQIELSTGTVTQLPTPEANSYQMRWVSGGEPIIELNNSPRYQQLDPFTGKLVRDISVPGASFSLQNNGLVLAKRIDSKESELKYFADFLQSGTLKTIANIQLDTAEQLESFRLRQMYQKDDAYAWVSTEGALHQIDITQSKIIDSYPFSHYSYTAFPKNENAPARIAHSPSWDTPLSILSFDSGKNEFTPPANQLTSFSFKDFAFHPNKPEFFATDQESNVHFFRITRAGLAHQVRGKIAESIEYTPDGSNLVYTSNYGEVMGVAPADTFPVDQGISYQGSRAASIAGIEKGEIKHSSDGNWVATSDTQSSFLHKPGKPEIVSTLGYSSGIPSSLAFSPDSSQLVQIKYSTTASDNNNTQNAGAFLLFYELSSEMPESPDASAQIKLSHGNFHLLNFNEQSTHIRLLDSNLGQIIAYDISDLQAPPSKLVNLSLPADAQHYDIIVRSNSSQTLMAIGHGTSVQVIDCTTPSAVLSTLSTNGQVKELHFLGNQRHLIAETKSGTLQIFDTQTLDENTSIASLNFYNNGADYLLAATSGYFDTSSGIRETGFLTQGARVIPFPQIFTRQFEPNLFAQVFTEIEFPTENTLTEFVQIPEAKLLVFQRSAMNYTLKVRANSPQYPLEELNLYQNEKLIRSFKINDSDGYNDEIEVRLLPEKNVFKLIAINTAGVASSPATRIVAPPKAIIERELKKQSGRTLHILAVGVNEYQNNEYNLNFAVADAKAILDQISKANASLFDQIKPHLITNAQANRNGILTAFETIKQETAPQDAFLFYFAGHGVMDQKSNRFYLVPTDVTRIYGDSQSLAQNGISASALRDLSAAIPAQKQLFILDACNSAGALEVFAERGASQEKAIAQLARSTGTHWIAASSSNQFATEFKELGHGAFTYTLLKAINGEADTGDRRVTVNELKAYLESELPNVTKKHKGLPQYPASFGSGQDFPIALIP